MSKIIKHFRFLFVVSIIIVAFSISPKIFAFTVVTADIIADTTWDLAGSPYIIQNDIHVASAVTLTIEPGVIVKLSQSNILWIDGKLLAEGTADNKIVFTSIDDDSYRQRSEKVA